MESHPSFRGVRLKTRIYNTLKTLNTERKDSVSNGKLNRQFAMDRKANKHTKNKQTTKNNNNKNQPSFTEKCKPIYHESVAPF